MTRPAPFETLLRVSLLILILPFCLFTILLLIQICIFQFYRPKNEDAFVFQLFLFFPLFLWGIYLIYPFYSGFSRTELLEAYPLFFFLCAAWIASYPAIYAACPTLLIAYYARKQNGINIPELESRLHLKENSMERVSDAFHNGLISQAGKTIKLTPQGQIFLRAFSFYRKVIGRKMSTL